MKRKILMNLIVIGTVVTFLTMGFLSEVKTDQEVTFPDKNLENVIREKIGKSSGPIYESDLLEITELMTNNKGIESIEGLEYCKNLDRLDLSENIISDISPVSKLKNLTELKLDINIISDISPVSNLTNLVFLYLYQNNISDISPLSDLTNLNRLNLGDNGNIPDISPLTNLTNLEWLDIGSNDISDIAPLSNLVNLTELRLYSNNIFDISPLVRNTGINEGDRIDIGDNPLSVASIEMYIPELESRGVEVAWGPVIETPVTTTPPPTTAPPQKPISLLYIGIFGAIVILILAVYVIRKK